MGDIYGVLFMCCIIYVECNDEVFHLCYDDLYTDYVYKL